MGAAAGGVCQSCWASAPVSADNEPAQTSYSTDSLGLEKPRQRVQAITDLDYGSAGTVRRGATGKVEKNTPTATAAVLVEWEASPSLGKVAVRTDQLVFIAEEKTGPHVVTKKAAVTGTANLSKEVIETLPVGTHIDILEVVHRLDSKRWRGRIDKPVRGWLSILSSEDGHRWASPAHMTHLPGLQPNLQVGPAVHGTVSRPGVPSPAVAYQSLPQMQHRPYRNIASSQAPSQASSRSQSFDMHHRAQNPVVQTRLMPGGTHLQVPGNNVSRSTSFNSAVVRSTSFSSGARMAAPDYIPQSGGASIRSTSVPPKSFHHVGDQSTSASSSTSTPIFPRDYHVGQDFGMPNSQESSERRLVYRQDYGSAAPPARVTADAVPRLASEFAARTPRRVDLTHDERLGYGGDAGGGYRGVDPAPQDAAANSGYYSPSVPEGPIISGAPKRGHMYALGADPAAREMQGVEWDEGLFYNRAA